MGNFFKGIGKGLYNIVIIPVWAIGLVLSSIAALGIWFWQLFKLIGRFFTGRNLSLLLPEDIQAKEMLKPALPKEEEKEGDDVEVVYAEITDPGARFTEIKQEEPAPRVTTTVSNEDVDFVINEAPVEIEFPNTMPQVRPNNFEAPKNDVKEDFVQPSEEVFNENNTQDNEPEEEKIEMYSPKGSDF